MTLSTLEAGLPLQASQYDWLWGLGGIPVLLMVIFWLAAVVSIAGSGFSFGAKVLFILGTLAFPFLGPLVWFVAVRGREAAGRQ